MKDEYVLVLIDCADESPNCDPSPLRYDIYRKGSFRADSGSYCYEHAARRVARMNAEERELTK